MKTLRQEDFEILKEKVYELISRTSIEIGQKTDGKTMASLSKIFAVDLMNERRFGKMSFNQIDEAFRQGVRFGKEEPFLNIRTFYKWVYAHKHVIDDATYQTETLGQKNVPFYQEPIKLLK